MKYIHKVIKYFSATNSRTLILLTGTLCLLLFFSLFIPEPSGNSTQKIAQDYVCSPYNCSGTCVDDPQGGNDFCMPSGGGSPIDPCDSNQVSDGKCPTPAATATPTPTGTTSATPSPTAGASPALSPTPTIPANACDVCEDVGSNQNINKYACPNSSGVYNECSLASASPNDRCVPCGSTGPSVTPNISPSVSPTLSQGSASLSLNIKLPGIGSNELIGENTVPKHRERDFKILFFNKDDKLTKEVEGRLNFDGTLYKGTVQIPNLDLGNYTIKIKSNNSLLKSVPGVINLQNGVTTQVPQITLVSGNVNDSGDSKNNLNILDYNSVISYFGKSVNDVDEELADLNDDGVVNEKDINILLRGFIIRKGD